MNHSSLMSYHEFFSALSHALLLELGDTYETHAVSNAKNNGIRRNGIVIRHENERTAPTIYLDSYYQEYQSGRILSDIVRHILYVYHESSLEQPKQELEQLELTAEYIRQHLIYTLVNYTKNQQLLQELPHIRIFDLAITFKLLVYQNNHGIGTIRFTNEHWQLLSPTLPCSDTSASPLHALYQLALANTEHLFPARLCSLSDTIDAIQNHKSLSPLSLDTPLPDITPTIYVLSNTDGINGAASILYPQLLSRLQEQLSSSFYLLPSSVHELLLLPANAPFSVEELNDMIREINLTQVPDEDILSDRAYHSSEWLEVLSTLTKHADHLPYTDYADINLSPAQ